MVFENKTILVTGGTGSIGRACVNRLLMCEFGTPKKIVVLSRDEAKQHDMKMFYLNKHTSDNFLNLVEFRLGDVCNYDSISQVVRDVDIVINIAAMKHVSICEYFPVHALETNCIGIINIIRAVGESGCNVETVLTISTDKACSPSSVMGMTKAIQERIITAANLFNDKTRFVCVRFGNILASRGSVVPLFQKQISEGGPITVTDPAMTRFFLGLDQAVDAIFTTIRDAGPGEIYVPNAKSASIRNIAKAFIGDKQIDIKIIGAYSGERVHEVLISHEEISHCEKSGDYYVILPTLVPLCKKHELDSNVKEFTSEDTLLSLEDTVLLLKKYNLI